MQMRNNECKNDDGGNISSCNHSHLTSSKKDEVDGRLQRTA